MAPRSATGLAHYIDVENRLVVGKKLAAAIEDRTPRRRHVLRMETVAVGSRGEVVVLSDLQVNQLQHESGEQQQHGRRGSEESAAEQLTLFLVIFKLPFYGQLHSPG